MSATQRLVDFVRNTPADAIPPEAREAARRAILDTLGVTLAGVGEDSARTVREIVSAEGGAQRATVIGTAMRTSAAGAAWANGTAGHALDYDDVTGSMSGHPSVPLVPAVLAAGEVAGASGREVVDAFLVGFEVECKVGRGVGRSHYARGFHATTTLGALGSAAACARLWDLTSEQTAHAMGIAASMSGGLRANFGSMTKPLQAGNAARAGVVAALLAQGGFTGGDDILDGPIGFVSVFSPNGDGDIEAVDGFGDPWEVVDPGISVKKYPCCYVTHRAADAALALASEHEIRAADVEHVEVHVPKSAFSSTGTIGPLIHTRPETGLEGKFSMEYVVASALLDGALRFPNFEDESVQRPAVQDLLRRVKTVGDDARHAAAAGDQYQAVEIFTRNGGRFALAVEEARGGPHDPLAWEELVEKFRDCAARGLPADRVEQSLDLIANLDDLDDIRRLTAALATGPTS